MTKRPVIQIDFDGTLLQLEIAELAQVLAVLRESLDDPDVTGVRAEDVAIEFPPSRTARRRLADRLAETLAEAERAATALAEASPEEEVEETDD